MVLKNNNSMKNCVAPIISMIKTTKFIEIYTFKEDMKNLDWYSFFTITVGKHIKLQCNFGFGSILFSQKIWWKFQLKHLYSGSIWRNCPSHIRNQSLLIQYYNCDYRTSTKTQITSQISSVIQPINIMNHSYFVCLSF